MNSFLHHETSPHDGLVIRRRFREEISHGHRWNVIIRQRDQSASYEKACPSALTRGEKPGKMSTSCEVRFSNVLQAHEFWNRWSKDVEVKDTNLWAGSSGSECIRQVHYFPRSDVRPSAYQVEEGLLHTRDGAFPNTSFTGGYSNNMLNIWDLAFEYRSSTATWNWRGWSVGRSRQALDIEHRWGLWLDKVEISSTSGFSWKIVDEAWSWRTKSWREIDERRYKQVMVITPSPNK